MTDLAEATTEVTRERTEIQNSLAFVRSFVIANDDDFNFAGEVLKDAKRNWKRLDERRKEITGPILKAKQGVDALFKPALEGLAQIESELKEKIGAFTATREAQRIATMRQSAEEYAAGGMPTTPIPVRPEASGVSVKPVWDFEVTDPNAVPREFCSPDPDKLKASRDWSAYSEEYPPPAIPGVRFYLRQAVRVRT